MEKKDEMGTAVEIIPRGAGGQRMRMGSYVVEGRGK
jgi:hypothetical protein